MKDNSFKKKANAATPHICNLRTPRIANRMNANTWRLPIISNTPTMMSRLPMAIDGVNASPNTKMPTTTAVTGSNAPMIAVGVEPTSSMARVMVTNEITVGATASITA